GLWACRCENICARDSATRRRSCTRAAAGTMNSPWQRDGGCAARNGFVNRWGAGCYRYNYRKDPPMRSPGSALSFGLLCLFLVGCSRTSNSVKAASAADEPAAGDSIIHKAAPDFALKDRDGATVHLSDYKGKVVMLDFWATWCGPCKIEIPWFMEFEQQYKDKGFAVLGVSMDEGGWDEVKPYIEERKINYRILLGDDKV